MNKFGLLDDEDDTGSTSSIADKLASFPPIRARQPLDLASIDAAAAQHGFISREAAQPGSLGQISRRRRAIPSEPTRHLAIRLTTRAYDRFVAYADRHKLTYHDALMKLMHDAGEE